MDAAAATRVGGSIRGPRASLPLLPADAHCTLLLPLRPLQTAHTCCRLMPISSMAIRKAWLAREVTTLLFFTEVGAERLRGGGGSGTAWVEDLYPLATTHPSLVTYGPS